MKKFFIILCLFLLCACSGEKEDQYTDEEYIEPINEVEVFKYLKDDLYTLLYKANGGVEIPSYILDFLGKELVDYKAIDYYGNEVDLNDYKDKNLIFEIAGNWCSHCKEQAKLYTDKILEKYKDVVFIQFFNEGTNEQIDSFYKEIGMDLPKNIIIIPEDKNLSNLILSNYNPQYYPAFLLFKDGKLSFVKTSSLTPEQMELSYDVAFKNPLTKEDLIDNDGNSIFKHRRNKEDVIADLSLSNYSLLKSLDNDNVTIDNTLKFIGKDFDFYSQYENDSTFKSEVDFLNYADRELVIIYLSENNDETIKLINECYKDNEDVSIIVLNVTDENNDELAIKLDAPLVSILNQVPRILNQISFYSFPSAVYVQKGIITGCYSNIKDVDSFKLSTNIFLKDNCIALVKNNH